MAEYVRSIEVTIRLDTNKRTIVHNIDATSLDDAAEQFRDEISDLRWLL